MLGTLVEPRVWTQYLPEETCCAQFVSWTPLAWVSAQSLANDPLLAQFSKDQVLN